MQSADYHDLEESYGPKTLAWKIRKALLEGHAGRYAPDSSGNDSHGDERERYHRLLRRFSANDEHRLAQLKYQFMHPEVQEEHAELIRRLILEFHPRYGNWRNDRFSQHDITDLIEEEVIVDSSANSPEDVIRELTGSSRRQVVRTDLDLVNPEINYKKPGRQRTLLLNGAKTIREFSKGRFELAGKVRMTNKLYDKLSDHQFSFSDALFCGLSALGHEVVLGVKRPDGNITYMFLSEMFEGTELYYETRRYRPHTMDSEDEDLLSHGRISDGSFKYHGENTFRVPRRTPTRKRQYDHVRTKYLPNLERPSRDMWLEWFNTEMACDCDRSKDYRNKEERTGHRTVRYTGLFDAHCRWAIHIIGDRCSSSQDSRGEIVYPTPFAIGVMDAVRYRLHNKRGCGKLGLNTLMMAAAKMYGPNKLLQTQAPAEATVIRPLYSGIIHPSNR